MEKEIVGDKGNEHLFLFSYTQSSTEASGEEKAPRAREIFGIFWLSY